MHTILLFASATCADPVGETAMVLKTKLLAEPSCARMPKPKEFLTKFAAHCIQ